MGDSEGVAEVASGAENTSRGGMRVARIRSWSFGANRQQRIIKTPEEWGIGDSR